MQTAILLLVWGLLRNDKIELGSKSCRSRAQIIVIKRISVNVILLEKLTHCRILLLVLLLLWATLIIVVHRVDIIRGLVLCDMRFALKLILCSGFIILNLFFFLFHRQAIPDHHHMHIIAHFHLIISNKILFDLCFMGFNNYVCSSVRLPKCFLTQIIICRSYCLLFRGWYGWLLLLLLVLLWWLFWRLCRRRFLFRSSSFVYWWNWLLLN